nr:hypothetical protein CFP56_56454 [Quercus suber]
MRLRRHFCGTPLLSLAAVGMVYNHDGHVRNSSYLLRGWHLTYGQIKIGRRFTIRPDHRDVCPPDRAQPRILTAIRKTTKECLHYLVSVF